MAIGSFQFRFDALLRLRRMQRDVERARVTELQTRLTDVRAESTRVNDELQRIDDAIRAIGRTNIDVVQLRDHSQRQRVLWQEQDEIRGAITDCEAEITAATSALVTADQAVKTLENLASRDAEIFKRRRRKAESAAQDEAANARYCAGRCNS